ncbi:hypothetical protein LCGC14_0734190 [marine sediment metagenome]|uniref:Terminase large subunit gp17-like C-terminal domain-containing protein n=1 Tax=marine sediment metagenome TaxID=412755 RepID=A0A0F9QTN2_9ZZZZ
MAALLLSDIRVPSLAIPKGVEANLAYRKKVGTGARRNPEFRSLLLRLCREDILFYVNTFVWTFNPKLRGEKVIPFVTYPFQDEAFREIVAAVADHDLVIEKSRDMGASWMCVTVFDWFARFFPYQTFLMVSRKEDLVDKTGDPKSLFYKIDFIHRHLPGWLVPSTVRTNLHMEYLETNSTIDGESTTGDVGRGDRRTAVLCDEFAMVQDGYKVNRALRDVADCRLFNSTPAGAVGAFYDHVNNPDMRKVTLHWSEHPVKAEGLYRDAEGRLRSPWYDLQCRRANNPVEIAIELDIDYKGSSYGFYGGELIKKIKTEDVQPPLSRGRLDFDESCKPTAFVSRETGELLLWFSVSDGGKPAYGAYGIGVDVASGAGAKSSNSVLSIVNRQTGEKVGEFAQSHIEPHEFARLCVAVARWFCDAYIIWEANGPGASFGKEVIRQGYRNFYYRRNERKLSDGPSQIPGWYNTPESGFGLHSEYRLALNEKRFLNRSFEAVEELEGYVYMPGGRVQHIASFSTEDPSASKDNHGDRVIADALASRSCAPVTASSTAKPEPVVLPHSFLGRRQEYERGVAMKGVYRY